MMAATNHTLIFTVLIGVAFAQECPVRSATTFLIAPDGCDCRFSRPSSSCVWEDSQCVPDGLLSWAVSVIGSSLTEDDRCEVGIEVPPEAMEGSRQVTMLYCGKTYTLTISNGMLTGCCVDDECGNDVTTVSISSTAASSPSSGVATGTTITPAPTSTWQSAAPGSNGMASDGIASGGIASDGMAVPTPRPPRNSCYWCIAVGVVVGIIVIGIAVGLPIAVHRFKRNKKGTHTLGNGENGDGDGGNPGRPIIGRSNADGPIDEGDGGMTGDTSGPTDNIDGHDTMLPMNVVMATKNLSPRTFPANAYSRRTSEPSGEHFNGSDSAIDQSIVKTFSCGQLQQGQETQSPTQVSDQQPAQPVVAFGRDATVLPLRTSSSITFIGEK